jgi:hypothetical protein
MDPERMIIYPYLIFRTYIDSKVTEKAILKIAMRCYYPEEFTAVIRNHGFEILNQWGGYSDELYGLGPELVVEFRDPR